MPEHAPRTLLAAILLLGACAGTPRQIVPFPDADLKSELADVGDAEGLVWLKRHVRVWVDASSDPSRATSVITFHGARARLGEATPNSPVSVRAPRGAKVTRITARRVGSAEEELPTHQARILDAGLDPEQKTIAVDFPEQPPGSVVELIVELEVEGTLATDARPLAVPEGPTRELLLSWSVPSHGEADAAVIGADRRVVRTERDGRKVLAVMANDVPAGRPESAYVRYVTRSVSPRNYDQPIATSWARVTAPYLQEFTVRTKDLRVATVPPLTADGGGESGVRQLAEWTRDRIQRPDALASPWNSGRELPPVIQANDLTQTDKIHLLLWLLETSKIDAKPAMGRSARFPALDPALPTAEAFDVPLVYVPAGDLWLDPACRTCEPGEVRPALRGRQAVVLPADGKLRRLPGKPPLDEPKQDRRPQLPPPSSAPLPSPPG